MKRLHFAKKESIFGYVQRIKSQRLFNQLPLKAKDMLLSVSLAETQRQDFVSQFLVVCKEDLKEAIGTPVNFGKTLHKNNLAICRHCIDDGASHDAYLQLAHVSYCEAHNVLLTSQCPACKRRIQKTNSRLCRACYNILPKQCVSPSSQIAHLQKLLLSKPEDLAVLVNVLTSLLMRPLDTFDSVFDLNELTDMDRFTLMSYLASVIVESGKFDFIRRAMCAQIEGKSHLGIAHKEAIRERWEACGTLVEDIFISEGDFSVNPVEYPHDIFASLAHTDVAEYSQNVEISFIDLEHLPKILGCDKKTIKILIGDNVFKIYKKRRINGHFVDAQEINKTLTKQLVNINSTRKFFTPVTQLNLKTLTLFRANLADVIQLIVQGDLKGGLLSDTHDAPLMTRIAVDDSMIETALTLSFLDPKNAVGIDDFCKSLAVPTTNFVEAWHLGKFHEWHHKPSDTLTPTQVFEFLTKYESLRRLSKMIGCTERKVLSYVGEDIEGIVKIKFNDKNNPSAFLSLNMQNFKYINEIKNKLLPSIKWQSQ
jgi:hypothetical protein